MAALPNPARGGPRPVRGRPPVIDPNAVVEGATALLAERGFANTTMTQIAETCGISRKSLFFYFPTKADLIWGSFDHYVEGLRSDLASISNRDAAPLSAIADAATAGFRFVPLQPETLKAQIRLIELHEELRRHGEARSLPWREVVSSYLLGHGIANKPLADGLAYAVWRALWTALTQWADSELPTPLLLEASELTDLADAITKLASH